LIINSLCKFMRVISDELEPKKSDKTACFPRKSTH